MVRTERFRGRLMAGDVVIHEKLEGQLKSLPRGTSAQGEWTGHFEMPVDLRERVIEGNRYRIVLIDGRSGHVSIHVRDNETDPLEPTLAQFHGTGSVRR